MCIAIDTPTNFVQTLHQLFCLVFNLHSQFSGGGQHKEPGTGSLQWLCPPHKKSNQWEKK